MLPWLPISRSGNEGLPAGRQGFTLLEILISISIAASVGILLAQVFFTTVRTNTKTELLKDVKQNGEYAVGIMERMIRSALRVQSTCTTTGSTLLSIQIVNPNGDTTTFGCLVDGTVTRIASTSSTAVTEYLTSSNVTIGGASCSDAENSLSFVCTSYPDQASRVTVSFSLSEIGTPPDKRDQASVEFQTSTAPRNK